MTAPADLLTHIDRQLATLPPEALQQVALFVRKMTKQYAVSAKPNQPLRSEPFVGMWANRSDMEDSTNYVRKLRIDEWK